MDYSRAFQSRVVVTGDTMSPVIVVASFRNPSVRVARVAGPTGTTSATGRPYRVTRTGRPVQRTRSITDRHWALNFEIGMASMSGP